jgi:SAM-dependent methyltransferase
MFLCDVCAIAQRGFERILGILLFRRSTYRETFSTMHSVNALLSLFGLRISRVADFTKTPKEFERQYKKQLEELQKDGGRFRVFKEFCYDAGSHPACYMDYECEFAARHLVKNAPRTVLDIGSYRLFVIGVLAGFKVTTLDIRPRVSSLANETIVTSDAKKLAIPTDSIDMVISLCTIEHFGLGRYGDEFDLNADRKAFDEMIRVLKPGGMLMFSTTITRGAPSIAFNAHRIYDYAMIREFCTRLVCVEEGFFSNKLEGACSFEQVVDGPGAWDVYCGCWGKKG